MNNRHLDYKLDNSNYQISENELYLTDYITIIRIHLKKIIAIFLMALFLGIYSTYSKVPKYSASASVIITQQPGTKSLKGSFDSDNSSIISDKIALIKSRGLLKLVVKEYWNSSRRNNMFLFQTRNFYPKGQKFRTLIKEIFTLGLFDAEKSMQTKVLDGPYTDEIGEKYVKSIQGKPKRL